MNVIALIAGVVERGCLSLTSLITFLTWVLTHYAYHGYWVNDPRVLNPRFGTADDLKALSKALHDRGMYLMVDIVVNNIPGTTINDPFNTSALVADRSIWTDSSEFHPQCWIDFDGR